MKMVLEKNLNRMASVDTIKRDLIKTIDAMKKNIEKFKKAKNFSLKKTNFHYNGFFLRGNK